MKRGLTIFVILIFVILNVYADEKVKDLGFNGYNFGEKIQNINKKSKIKKYKDEDTVKINNKEYILTSYKDEEKFVVYDYEKNKYAFNRKYYFFQDKLIAGQLEYVRPDDKENLSLTTLCILLKGSLESKYTFKYADCDYISDIYSCNFTNETNTEKVFEAFGLIPVGNSGIGNIKMCYKGNDKYCMYYFVTTYSNKFIFIQYYPTESEKSFNDFNLEYTKQFNKEFQENQNSIEKGL